MLTCPGPVGIQWAFPIPLVSSINGAGVCVHVKSQDCAVNIDVNSEQLDLNTLWVVHVSIIVRKISSTE